MKKRLCALIATAAIAFSAFAVNVDEAELQVSGSVDLQFENYGGPHAHIDTAEAIVNIGTGLGRHVALDVDLTEYYEPRAKYSLIHVVDPSVKDGRDADILVLNENAGVDHIKNLRRIVTGFLQAAYDYNRQDAETLSIFITVYNAVYRNQISVFQERYKPAVLSYLDADKVGLSTNWEDWAGKTQLVIPLNSMQAGLSVVDTTTITDEKVIDAMRQEDDKSIEARENMTELKEREAEAATEKAQEAQKQAAAERKEGNVEEAKQAAELATEEQKVADRKNLEVKKDSQAIETDKAILNGETVPVVDKSSYLTGLFAVDNSRDLYTLITVDGTNGDVILRSPVRQIKGKTVYIVENITIDDEGNSKLYDKMFLAVCGVNDGHSAIRLCLIDSDTLELRAQSEQILSENTEFLSHGNNYYVAIQGAGGKYVVASFDKNLKILNQSELTVSPSTPFYEISAGLLVTDESGNPHLLDYANLNKIW